MTGGPLDGIRVLELTGLGPAPFAAMVLADLGAEVICLDRPGDKQPTNDPLRRGKRSIAVDLKAEGATDLVLDLVATVDVLIEGYRPGVAERLGLGPEPCLARNPALVYGRMTGWGQDGPRAQQAGHDVNYLGLTGALHHIGRQGQLPVPPVNFLGDFGGGGMLITAGILAALVERDRSGAGQVVDAAMVDGVSLLTASIHGLRAEGRWRDERGSNLIDTGAPYYDVYAAADGELLAVGALEKRFYLELLRVLDLDADRWPDRFDPAAWPEQRQAFAEAFATRPRQAWLDAFEGVDACVTPVLDIPGAIDDGHNRARGTFVELDGVVQPAPAPRFSRTPATVTTAGPVPGQHTDAVLEELGLDAAARTRLSAAGVTPRPTSTPATSKPATSTPPGGAS